MFRKITLSLIIFFLAGVQTAKAVSSQKPIPEPGKIPCTAKENPEFNSDRPYQASPCGDSPKALFCGNDLVITESIKKRRTSNFSDSMTVNIPVSKTYTVSVKDMELPILGNTELIKNSQNKTPQIDEATRMNEYVSAYLNGTNDQAENGPTDISKVVDFSGPIKKLLPSPILDAQRIGIIRTIDSTSNFVDESTNKTTSGKDNHNQIVVCGESSIPLIGNYFNIGTLTPIDCYAGNGTGAKGYLRLSDWSGDLSWWNDVANTTVSTVTSIVSKIIPAIPTSAINESIGNHWNKKTPPLPWDNDPFTGKPITKTEYSKYYNEWKGKTCVIVPGVNLVVCLDNIFVPNKYSDFFPYIPLANTSDKSAQMPVNGGSAEIKPSGGTKIGPDKDSQVLQSVNLYFPHTQESADLTQLLNKTYVPIKGTNNKVATATTEDNTSTDNTQCRAVDVRSNDGDNLFPEVPPDSYIYTAKFTITEIPCGPVEEEEICADGKSKKVTGNRPPNSGCFIQKSQSCDGEVSITAKTITKTPYADEIWQNTTAGNSSTFRKIYPKVGANSPVNCISDIPTVTNASYKLESVDGYGGTNTGDLSVNGPTGKSDGTKAQVFFPHLGSVYDYFLKGIQTALRPKGYGSEPLQSSQYCSNIACGELPKTLPKAAGSCVLGGVSSRVGNIPQSLKDIISAASQTYKVPPNLILGVMFGEGIFRQGRFNWTDANVKNWATCQKIPNCNESGDDNFMGFNGTVFQRTVPKIKADIQKIDPTRKTFSQCNLLDTIYAEAYTLHAAAAGGGGLPNSCFDIRLSSTIPNSCSWNDNQYENAIKVHETGYTADCLTLPGSCATGRGTAAACPGGDNCEKVGGSGNTSHNACVWDVGHGK